MKALLSVLALLVSLTAQAGEIQTDCKDSNFNGLESGLGESELSEQKGFKQLFRGPSPAPAGFEKFAYDGQICFATTATYLKHEPSGKSYVMFTTGDDYCDGGNTLGLIIDSEIYRRDQQTEGSVVAEVSDGEIYCRK